jgi:hypothetical protein
MNVHNVWRWILRLVIGLERLTQLDQPWKLSEPPSRIVTVGKFRIEQPCLVPSRPLLMASPGWLVMTCVLQLEHTMIREGSAISNNETPQAFLI